MADAYIKTILEDEYIRTQNIKIEFWNEPERQLGLDTVDEFNRFLETEQGHRFKNDPLLPLYRERQRIANVSVLESCPSVAKKVTSSSYSPRMIASRPHELVAQETANGEKWPNVIFQMSMPVLSSDRRLALLEASLSFGPMAAGGVSVLLRKDASGRWKIVRRDRTWIA